MDPSSERAYAEQPSAIGGNPPEGLPDFVPGWFKRRKANLSQVREAVRVIGIDSFPLCFLRPGETVGLPLPPQRGVTISSTDHPDFGLAVPPGWWIVRDTNGEIRNWSPENFADQFIRRTDLTWAPPHERVGLGDLAPSAESIASSRDGWKGTPPAEGTRRHLILRCLEGAHVRGTDGLDGYLSSASALALADSIEGELLDETIAREEAGQVWPVGSPERRACEAGIPTRRPFTTEAAVDMAEEKAARKLVAAEDDQEATDDVEESYAARLLRQREEARGGEDSFKHQRDAALNCLRWLIGDLLPNGGE